MGCELTTLISLLRGHTFTHTHSHTHTLDTSNQEFIHTIKIAMAGRIVAAAFEDGKNYGTRILVSEDDHLWHKNGHGDR